ncbi:hypothetical protein M427DRAFT_154450 [Gonapodya prolifera JEL478]|uniref:Uncharacterized protein n=1 Tax=Gonapodya prolifera (strain JEL478) TaxID=1344416 RepID=A0A139AIF0_GONPJ|nr:hypothetical protein M427DRAFT_154450 [Gonapodya prolifera JEL478]|eukprot:KXS16528.1 hypothetical protein M427DRAFT_154450 [Gonapodya prolifera JEL478]
MSAPESIDSIPNKLLLPCGGRSLGSLHPPTAEDGGAMDGRTESVDGALGLGAGEGTAMPRPIRQTRAESLPLAGASRRRSRSQVSFAPIPSSIVVPKDQPLLPLERELDSLPVHARSSGSRRSSFSGRDRERPERPVIVLEPGDGTDQHHSVHISLSIHPGTSMDERGPLGSRPSASDLSVREVALLSRKLEEQWVVDHAAQGEGLQVEGDDHKVQFSPIPQTHTIPRDQALVPLESEYLPPAHTPPTSPPHRRRSRSSDRPPGERSASIGRPSSRLGGGSFASDLSLREVELLEEKLEERGPADEEEDANEWQEDDGEETEGGRRGGPPLSKVSFSPKPSVVSVPRDQVPVSLSLDGRPPSRGPSPSIRRVPSASDTPAGGAGEDEDGLSGGFASDMSLRELDLLEEKMAEKRERDGEGEWGGAERGGQGQVRFKGVAVVPVPKDQEHIPIEDEIDDIRIHSASTRSSSRISSTEHLRGSSEAALAMEASTSVIVPDSSEGQEDEGDDSGQQESTHPVGRYASDLSIKEIDMLEKVLDERDTAGDDDDESSAHGKVLFNKNPAVVHVPRDQPAISLDDELVTRSHGSLPHTPQESTGDGESVASDLSHRELAMLEGRLMRERTASGEQDDPRRGGDRVAFSPTPPEVIHVGKDQPRVRIGGIASSNSDIPTGPGVSQTLDDIDSEVPIVAGVVLGLGMGTAATGGPPLGPDGAAVERWASDLSLREMQILERKREEKEDEQGGHKVSFSRKASVVRVERDQDAVASVEDLLQSAKRSASPGLQRSPSARTAHLLDADDLVSAADVESDGATTAYSGAGGDGYEVDDLLAVPGTGEGTGGELDQLPKVGSDLSIREVEILERKLAASPGILRSQSRDGREKDLSPVPVRRPKEGHEAGGVGSGSAAGSSSELAHPRPHRLSWGAHGSVRFAERSAVVQVPRDQDIVKEIEDKVHMPGSSKGKAPAGMDRAHPQGSSSGDRVQDPSTTNAGEEGDDTGDMSGEPSTMARYASDLSVKEIGMLEKRLSREFHNFELE